MAAGHGIGKIDGLGKFFGMWTLGYSNYNNSLGIFYGEESVMVNGAATSGLILCGAN